jgi:hypothetical protein
MKGRVLIISTIIMLIIFSANLVLATNDDYYADLFIVINERGDVSISGNTNHPNITGSFQDMTSKQGRYWVFNISEDNFSTALFEISFPKDTVITYIKSSARITIHSNDAPTIKGILKDKPLEIIVQYYFEDPITSNFPLLLLFGSILLILGLFFIFTFRKKTDNGFDLSSLTSRQRKIIELLIKKDGVTQNFLEKELGWPKSSLSRNVASLERKGLIVKINKGNSNVISLNKPKLI